MFKVSIMASAVLSALTFTAQADNATTQPQNKSIQLALQQANIQQINHSQLVEVIQSEQASRFGYANITDAFNQSAGIQSYQNIDEAYPQLAIRGLTNVQASLNGRDIISVGQANNVSQQLPVTMLSGATLYKSRAASQTETGLGGLIDATSYRPFDFEQQTFVVNVATQYQQKSAEAKPELSTLYTNRWQLSAGDLGILVNLSSSQTNTREDENLIGPLSKVTESYPHTYYYPSPIWDSESQSWVEDPDYGDYLLNPSPVSFSTSNKQLKQQAANLALQWQINPELELVIEGFYNNWLSESHNSVLTVNTLLSEGFTPVEQYTAPQLFAGTNSIKALELYKPDLFLDGVGKHNEYQHSMAAVELNWQLNNHLSIHSQLYAQSNQVQNNYIGVSLYSQLHKLQAEFGQNGFASLRALDNPETLSIDEADLAQVNEQDYSGLYQQNKQQKADGTTFTTRVDWRMDGLIQQLSFGVKAAQLDREIIDTGESFYWSNVGTQLPAKAYSIVADGLFDNASSVQPFITVDGDYLLANTQSVIALFNLQDEPVEQAKNVQQTDYAAFVTVDYQIGELFGELGARYVNYNIALATDKINDFETSNLLPSLSLNWLATDNFKTRLNYNKTLKMPQASSVVLQSEFKQAFEHNWNIASLKPELATNLDLSLEWQFAANSYAVISLFKREVRDEIIANSVTYTAPGSGDTWTDVEFPQTYTLVVPTNAAESDFSGIEAGLTWFPTNLDGLGIQASYTKLDIERKIVIRSTNGEVRDVFSVMAADVAEQFYHLAALYQLGGFDARLAYSWQDNSLVEYASYSGESSNEIWSDPQQSLDFRMNYHINQNITVSFTANNILQENVQTRYGKETALWNNRATISTSRSFALGVSFNY